MPQPAFTKGRFAAPRGEGSVGPYMAEGGLERLYHSSQPGISARDIPGAGTAPGHAQGPESRLRLRLDPLACCDQLRDSPGSTYS
jgi:hypothetical protein